MKILLTIVLGWTCALGAWAQPINDDCATAFHLQFTDDWCSEPGEYTNLNATPFTGPPPANPCFLDFENEVWFTFIPQSPAIYVRVTGAAFGLGTLRNPAIAIFEGTCNNLTRIGCNIVSGSTNQVELSVESLTIGAVYYLLVEGQNDNTGTFEICLDGFIPPPSPQSDCANSVILCDKSAFVVDTLLGTGIPDQGVSGTCVQQELSSAWYTWTCETSGTLTFTLTPNGYQPGFESDDIDFVVYQLPNGLDDCSNKIVERCMASGANVGEPFSSWQRCNGPTGLRDGDPDDTEPPGCQNASQNNFAAPLQMVAGRSYALLVNNFSQSGLGFSIEWGGTGTFQGPEPAFDVTAVQAFECDKTIIFDNESLAPTDSIVAYYWNFGAGATPRTDSTTGPISVVYESFGHKRVALTVLSEKGCLVTEILDFYVEPCCADTSTLMVTATIQDQVCPNSLSGAIQAMGISGSAPYQYSLDCMNYQPASVFPYLAPGEYTLCIQDEKGCESQITVEVLPASGFWVEAGDTIAVQLGETAEINAVAFPRFPEYIQWTNIENFVDTVNLLNPTVLPTTSGYYIITIEDEFGCVTSDSVLILVDAFKPIYIPNVITPNNDYVNDRLTAYGNNAATGINTFQIYDRWGGLLWERTDFDLNDETLGWDGTVNGKPVSPGVFAYRVVIDFLDDIPAVYTGTVTVVR